MSNQFNIFDYSAGKAETSILAHESKAKPAKEIHFAKILAFISLHPDCIPEEISEGCGIDLVTCRARVSQLLNKSAQIFESCKKRNPKGSLVMGYRRK